jgi:microcystin-dependent protein
MAYASGLNQRVRNQLLSTNISAQDQSITETNLSLLANLKYVQDYINHFLQVDLLSPNNPNFTGNMTSTTGGNISILSTLAVPTIASNTNFTGSVTVQSQPVSTVIVGEIQMTTAENPPPGFLLCNGQSVSKANYQDLFDVIAYDYGGSGANFNLPNMQSRFPIGANGFQNIPVSNFAAGNNSIGANNTYNSIGGNTVPTWSAVPPHTHNLSDPGHVHGNSNYRPAKCTQTGNPTIPRDYCLVTNTNALSTDNSFTGFGTLTTGTDIAPTFLDPISNLPGVNISLPYVAVNYCIAY